ncbi:MAG: hypothetical protein ACXACB_15360, partial [Promethearchaeota archaeon]
MLFKTPKKTNKPTIISQGGEENPSTACRDPKKRRLIAMERKTGVFLLILIASIVLVGMTFLPPTLPPVPPESSEIIFQTLFNQTYGGTNIDIAFDLVQTHDGGFALVGYTDSYGAGRTDIWLVKTDSNGVMIWNRTYGGINHEWGKALIQTVDGGLALLGNTEIYQDSERWNVMFLMKTDADGVMIWNRTYGGPKSDAGLAVIQTLDGGFALVGDTKSFAAGFHGSGDIWLVKTDANGNVIWHQTYGSTAHEEGGSVIQTVDGGFALVGSTQSDMWLVKTDTNGKMIWNQTYGGNESDRGHALIQTV